MHNTTYKAYIKEITKHPLLSAEQERALSKRIMNGDKDAQQILINSNLRYVVTLAHKYAKCEESLMDCIQEGNLGLMVAASKFDYNFKTRFSTYANPWIVQYILRHKNLVEPTIHIPALKVEKLRIIRKATAFLEQKLGKPPTNEELAIFTGFDEKLIFDLKNIDYTVCSLEPKEHCAPDVSLLQFLSDETTNPEVDILEQFEREEFMSLIAKLPQKERLVMTDRYTSYIEKKNTSYKNMGLKLGVSIEATRQIEMRAKLKLQNIFKTHFNEVYNEKIIV